MMMPGRQYSSDEYRFGFNGMEKDDEIKGNGNSYDFGARIYDPRVGRWLSVDPDFRKYESLSPYNFVNNMPIIAIDPNEKGVEIVIDEETDKASLTFTMNVYLSKDLDLQGKSATAYIQKAFPDFVEGQPYIIDVPVEKDVKLQTAEGYNNRHDLESIKIVLNVIYTDDVEGKMEENNDASNNYFELRSGQGGGTADPTRNRGILGTEAFSNGPIGAQNVLIDELWHTAGAMYDKNYAGMQPNNPANKFGNHNELDENSVCKGIFSSTENSVTQADIDAIRKGSKKITPSKGGGPYNFKGSKRAVVGKNAKKPVDKNFKSKSEK